MKKRVRRILSFILTAVMIFALMPIFGKPMVVKADDAPAHVAHKNKDTDGSKHSNWEKISTWDDLKKLGEKGGSGYLGNNIKISESFIINSGKTVNLCLNGCSVIQTADKTDTDTITVYGTLNLYDEKDNSGIITHASTKTGSGVYIEKNGTFTMNGGTISGNNAEYGGGVRNNGTFAMTGGTISGNNAEYGGGVENWETFAMTGGTISGNKAEYGGGVLNYGTFAMTGGTISGNKAEYGGGVFNNGGTFTMNEGTIEGNSVTHGGGVLNYGTFAMNGGTISGNNAKYGGGVGNSGTFTMTEGEISGNKANRGGGVGNYYGTFTMEGGTIKENKVEKKGAGVYLEKTFIKEGGNIEGSIECPYSTIRTVTFNANDESDKTIIQYVIPNEETNLAPNKFTYVNDRFDCWNTNADGNGDSYQDNAIIKIDKDLVLYTKFVNKISYEVTFNVDNGSWSDGTNNTKTVTIWRYEDEDKTLLLKASEIPSINPITGYKGSWDTEPDTEKALTENKTYTYTFEPIEYTIHYDPNGGVGTINDQSRTYDDKAPLTTNTFTFEGKTFNGWNTADDGSGTHFKDEEVNNLSSTEGDTVTLYAQWTTNTYTVSWKDYDGTVLETDTDVAYGSTPSYDGETPIKEKEGNKEYTFSGWTPAIDIVKGAATYTATYCEEEIVEPTEPTTPEEPINPTTPEEPTEPEVPEITEPEPEVEIPEKDWLDDLRLKLQIANELGGPRTVEYSGDFALSYDIMQYLVEHPDITFVYHVTYEGQEYTITIPAGKAIADPNIGWYGPLWLLANYGGENVPDIIAGSGRYTVVEGDTLSGIAAKFNTTVEELAKRNGIKDPNYIIVGQVIVY